MPTYGSQWHLLRYLGYHRDELNRAVQAVIPGSSSPEWLDFTFEQQPGAINADPPRTLDREFEGINFLPDALRLMLQSEWAAFWPQGGSPPNWDAVGKADVRGCPYWLVVEAKSHLREIENECKAAEHGGRPQIRRAFELTQAANGIAVDAEPWLGPYYQYCNRVSFVHFLNRKGIPAKMLFVYFLGDRFPPNQNVQAPATEQQWRAQIALVEQHIGWNPLSSLAEHVHKLFLPVCPGPVQGF